MNLKGSTQNLVYGLLLITVIGSLLGWAIDRTQGRDLSQISIFKSGLSPDGIHYTVRTLRYLNVPESEILKEISQQYKEVDIEITDYYLNPDDWEKALVDSRVLYSILSVPFVMFMGPNGMFVIPIMSYVFLVCTPFLFRRLILHKQVQKIDFILAFVLATSFYVKFNILSNTTDGLSTILISSLILILMYVGQHSERAPSHLKYAAIPCLSLATCATRQNEIFVFGLFFIFAATAVKLSRFERIQITFVAGILNISWLVFSFIQYDNYSVITSANGVDITEGGIGRNLGDIFTRFPITFIVEIIQLLLRDSFIFILIGVAIYITTKNAMMPTFLSLVFLWTLLSGILLTTINGGLGSGFRYALASIFSAALVISENLKNKGKID